MTNEVMLGLIRADRPNQVIHEVKSFEVNEYGFYDVHVDMQLQAFGTTIKHAAERLPYPLKAYKNLTQEQAWDWRWGE
jgi:hypothetical protein